MRTRRLMLTGPSRSSSSSSRVNFPLKGKPDAVVLHSYVQPLISARRRGNCHARRAGVFLNIVKRLAHDLQNFQASPRSPRDRETRPR